MPARSRAVKAAVSYQQALNLLTVKTFVTTQPDCLWHLTKREKGLGASETGQHKARLDEMLIGGERGLDHNAGHGLAQAALIRNPANQPTARSLVRTADPTAQRP